MPFEWGYDTVIPTAFVPAGLSRRTFLYSGIQSQYYNNQGARATVRTYDSAAR